MGGESGDGSNFRRGAVPSKGRVRTPADAPSGAAPGDLSAFKRRVRSAKGRIAICAEVAHEALIDDPSETRQRNLALVLRAVKVADDLIAKQALPKQMKALAAQLQADREERARMESGVQFADEGAQLPPLGGSECH